jgi:hypothetical protein
MVRKQILAGDFVGRLDGGVLSEGLVRMVGDSVRVAEV